MFKKGAQKLLPLAISVLLMVPQTAAFADSFESGYADRVPRCPRLCREKPVAVPPTGALGFPTPDTASLPDFERLRRKCVLTNTRPPWSATRAKRARAADRGHAQRHEFSGTSFA